MTIDPHAPGDGTGPRSEAAELAILYTVAQALNGEVDLDRALQTTLTHVARLLGLRTGWIWLLRPDGAAYLAAAHDLPPALSERPDRMEGSCYCLDTYRAGDLAGAANTNVVACSRLQWLSGGTRGLRYHASVPLYAHGKKLGVLNVASTGWRELSEAELSLLHTVGDMLSIAIERARLFERSAELGAAEERNRLAREIHDTLAQGFSGIALLLETADARLEAAADPEAARDALRQALALARDGLRDARRSVLDLRAAPLEGRTLPQALAQLAEHLGRTRGVAVDLAVTGGERPLPTRLEAGLYRVAQEALANVGKHAAASRVALRLDIGPERARLTVEDDGRGFDPSRPAPGGFGLLGLSERARLLGAELAVQSSPGAGTRLEVAVPLDGGRQGGPG